MKRITALLLALCVLFSLTACTDRSERQDKRRQLDNANGYTAMPDKDYRLADGTTLEPTEICNENGLTITAMGIYEDDAYYRIPFRIRNDSKEDISISVNETLVNGWTVYPFFYLDVVAGGMDETTMGISKSYDNLKVVLDTIRTISGSLYTYDEDYNRIDFPFSLSTSADDGTLAPLPENRTVLYDEGGIEISFIGAYRRGYYTSYYLTISNASSSEVHLDIDSDDCGVNGLFEEDALSNNTYLDVAANAHALFYISVYDSDLEDAGITSVESIQIKGTLKTVQKGEFPIELEFSID